MWKKVALAFGLTLVTAAGALCGETPAALRKKLPTGVHRAIVASDLCTNGEAAARQRELTTQSWLIGCSP